jgi:tetratricopeptide (TPR) repeat protein
MDPNAALQTNMLKSMIDQIQSLSIPPEKVQNAAPAQPASKTPAATMGPKISSPQKETPSSTASLDGIDAMAAPLNPLAVADALYRRGDYSRAVRFYEKAVGQGTDSDVSVRQWAMYQTANCMSRLDAGQAVQMYAKLLADYPSNPWAAAAMAQKRSLEWLAENQTKLNLRTDANVSKP